MKTRILIAIVLFASSCFAIVTNLNSGATHSAINDAVSAASCGDTLLVSTSQYTYMQVNSKNLTIIGGYTPDFSTQVTYNATILDGFSYCALFNHSTSTVEGLTFTGAGYGMQVYNTSVVTCRHCAIEHNTHYSYGAGARVFGESLLVLDYTDIQNNSATNTTGNGDGGGVYVSHGTLIVSEYSHIRYNSAAEKGGGVYISDYSYVEVKDSSFISANTAGEAGGGVYITGGDLYVHDGGDIGYRLNVPNSTPGNGGGIYARNASVIFKDNYTKLLNSYAGNDGGGAYLTNSTMTFYNYADIGYDSDSKTNVAGNDGGGIFAIHSTVAITNADIHACRAGDNGGGICAENSEVILCNCEVGNTDDTYANTAGADGGAINAYGGNIFINKTTFFNNQAGDDGGAIRIDDSTLTITNSVFRNNTADDRAGALYALSGIATADIIDSSIITNIAGGDGGGIHWRSDSNLAVRSSVINANEAGDDGGGICALDIGQIFLDSIVMCYNMAEDDGGAIFLKDGELKVLNSELNDNKADSDNNGDGDGGVLHIYNSAEATFVSEDGRQMIRNSGVNGGAIHARSDAKVNIITPNASGYSIYFNHATNGGAVYLDDYATLRCYGRTRMFQNTAVCGGALFLTNGATAEFVTTNGFNSVICGSTAQLDGGAVFATGTGTTVRLKKVQIGQLGNPSVRNQAESSSGGGGGVALLDGASLTAINCLFQNNIALNRGGAIYADDGSQADIFGEFVSPVVSPPCVFSNNAAEYGAVFCAAAGSRISVNDALIVENTAYTSGGCGIGTGVGILDIENTVIANNTADVGGGIAVVAGGRTLLNYCTVAMNQSNGIEAVKGGAAVLSNTIVWGNAGVAISPAQSVNHCDIEGGYPGAGNLNLNPSFNNPTALDFSLLGISPCIDTGVYAGVNFDCVHEPRPYGDGYDIGAYEFIPEPCLFIIYHLSFIIYWRNFAPRR